MTSFRTRINWLFHSLFVRIIACAVFVMILAITLRYLYTHHKLVYIFKHNEITQQQDLANNFSLAVSQSISLRQHLLKTLAENTSPALLVEPSARDAWLETQQKLFSPLFSDIRIELSSDQAPPPNSLTIEDTGDITNNVDLPKPALSITQAIKGENGQPIVYIRAYTLFSHPAFWGDFKKYQNAKTGGFVLVMPTSLQYIQLQDGKIETHKIPNEEQSPIIDEIVVRKATQGITQEKQAGGAPTNQEIFAAVAVENTDWIAAAYISDEEVKSAVLKLLNDRTKIIPAILILFTLLAALAMYYFLRPLAIAAKFADKMTRGEIPLAPLPLGSNDELGALTQSFNRLISNLSEKTKELTAQREIADTAAASKSRFLAAASHDLRQPMHALNLYLGALAHFDLPAEARPVLSNVRECAQTMDEMFRALLDISKLDAQAVEINLCIFPIAILLEKIRKEYTPQAEAKGLQFKVMACSAYIHSDPELLERIVRNLVSNAVRYTSAGKILVGCRRSATGLQLHVFDTGSGIAPDHQKAIFEEFYQANNPGRDREQGLGLGLAIVQRLTLLLKIPLQLISQPGQGSVFSINLERAHELQSTLEGHENSNNDDKRTLEGSLIALVDDEILILNATSLLMKQWGCSVISATSGAELFELLSLSPRVPNALVCDHRLGNGETGVEVIAILRDEFNTDIPAILITGDTSRDQIQKMTVTQFPILHKPLQEHILKSALIKLINQDSAE